MGRKRDGGEVTEIRAEIHLPKSICGKCGYVIDMATDMLDPAFNLPKAGDISLCLRCGHLSIFDENLKLREPSDQEIMDILRDKEQWELILRAEAAIKEEARRMGNP